MKGKIQTVLGLIDPHSLGLTLTHEHLIHSIKHDVFARPLPPHCPPALGFETNVHLDCLAWIRQHPYSFSANRIFDDDASRSAVREEMHLLKQSGGGAVVEVGSIGIRSADHPQFLRSIALETGLHIVAGTGYYVSNSQSESVKGMSCAEMEMQIREDLLEGISGSQIKCGVIGEIGCSYPLEDVERRSLMASGVVQEETGCPVIIHPGRDKSSPAESLRVLLEAGGKKDKTVMSHLERSLLTVEELLEFAALGCYCEFDLFGTENSYYQLNPSIDMPSDAQRINHLLHLVRNGYGDKIVISHDIHTKHRLMKFGGHGFSHIILNVVPKMKIRGFTDEDIEKILYTNPKSWLTFQ